ncbi:HET-domain-containing protein [Hyaloscypha hepaticicola]|uniref:HET-domain-containing protein n=1 Tax=Hyaloscypha hepaticicola TaxID=2082293 RepID=A0A2J6PIK1_9HELO|nr:HET-domain-containing protein [Hyaloscypha hepaticicola]
MRLLNVSTRELHEFFNDPPPYAILSHTWGKEEVTFEDLGEPKHTLKLGYKIGRPKYTSKLGYKKIDGCCKRAQLSNFEWVWIDTCCIDKSSSAELSETINSMFAWYQRSSICYIYLEDVPPADSSDHKAQGSAFRSSRWFTRGWTLQELLASKRRQIFDSTWQRIYLDSDARPNHHGPVIGPASPPSENEDILLSEITGIPKQCLRGNNSEPFDDTVSRTPLSKFSVSERMSWASRRSTTRVEDMAYCLLGIFEVNMPLLYGEGGRAFFRLQEEIIRKTPDETIFCWDHGHCQENSKGKPTAALALSPAEFTNGGELYESSTAANSTMFVAQRSLLSWFPKS